MRTTPPGVGSLWMMRLDDDQYARPLTWSLTEESAGVPIDLHDLLLVLENDARLEDMEAAVVLVPSGEKRLIRRNWLAASGMRTDLVEVSR